MNILLVGVDLRKREFILIATSYFALFTWYYIFSYSVLESILGDSTHAFSIYNASFNFLLSFALIVGRSFALRIARTSLIYLWSILSSVGAISIALVPDDFFRLAIYLLSGVAFGLGLLGFFTSFWSLTAHEERGRVAGLIGLVFLPVFSLVLIAVNGLGLAETIALCLILSLANLAIKPFSSHRVSMLATKMDLQAGSGVDPERRTILLYSIPWVIFSLINSTLAKAVTFHIAQSFPLSTMVLLHTLQIVGASAGAIIGGVVADFYGRRLSLALGLTLYGVSSAISGLANRYAAFSLVFIGSGLTWGILLTLYSFVVWGDLGADDTCSSRYAIGLGIFYTAAGLGILLTPQLLQIPLIVASVLSCLLIFISNAPLALAPELLSSDFREKIRLRLYLSFVKRIAHG